MQLGLIIGIVCAIGAVLFALQNVAPVTVTLGFWSFEGSLALVLLIAVGLGALIAGLVSSPAMIRHQWAVASLGRQIAELKYKVAEETRRSEELRAELSKMRDAAASVAPTTQTEPAQEEKPYVGLRTLISGNNTEEKKTG